MHEYYQSKIALEMCIRDRMEVGLDLFQHVAGAVLDLHLHVAGAVLAV